MRTDHRWLVVFAGNLLFLFVVSQVNHHLTNFPLLGLARGQLYLFLVGLPVAFAALRLSVGPAVLTTVVTALAVESGLPLPSGTILLPATACACVTLAPGVTEFTFEEMQDFLREKGLAKQYWPERLEVLDTLPSTPSGKIQKFALRGLIAGQP